MLSSTHWGLRSFGLFALSYLSNVVCLPPANKHMDQAKDFGFTKVFGSAAGQSETYESTMRPLVDDVFAAQNALLFAYGMTNAGKTYTVLGEDSSPGLIPQALT